MKYLSSTVWRRLAVTACVPVALALASAPSQAAYPEQPINLVVSYWPGGGTDLVARMMAPYLQKYLGGDARIGWKLVRRRSGTPPPHWPAVGRRQ